jgi:hypothetical protein
MASCEIIRRELSNSIDGDIDPNLRSAINDHLRQSHSCAALNSSTWSLLSIIRNECVFQVPTGYRRRLYEFLTERINELACFRKNSRLPDEARPFSLKARPHSMPVRFDRALSRFDACWV